MGKPVSGPGSIPTLPGQDPYDVDRFGRIDDPNDWQLWWMFNRERFLDFSGIDAGRVYSGGSGFHLGDGTESDGSRAGRLDDATIGGPLVERLQAAILKGGSYDFCRGAMVAASRLGGHASEFEYVTSHYLTLGDRELTPAAAFLLGLTGDTDDVATLRGIALNTEEGCAAITPEGERPTPRVPVSVRAFACYGLGMIGQRTPKAEVRQQIVEALIEVLENDASEANDARVAAMIALGFVPLDVDEEVVACYCGTCVVPDPHTSLRPQVTYLMRYFTAQEEFDPVLRAHAATAMGRLVAAGQDGMTDRMKEGIAEVLVRALARGSKQPDIVRESAVLALGLIGDADDGNVDQWIRWALRRSIKSGDPMEKRFALIALAETGGHRGQGEEPFAGLHEIRATLSNAMSRGRRDERAWGALAVGLLGYELRSEGQDLDPDVDKALVNCVRSGKGVDDLGAFALAAGLRRSQDALPHLVKDLERARDEAAAGYVAMGVGLIGADDDEAVETLREAFVDSEGKPLLQTRVGLALGLLDDEVVVDDLLARLAKLEEKSAEIGVDPEERADRRRRGLDDKDPADLVAAETAAIVTALGYIGDKRAFDVLSRLAVDENDEVRTVVREAAVTALGFMGDRSRRPWRVAMTLGTNYRAQTASLTTSKGEGVLDLR